MKETPIQTIARLEEVISKQKAELTEVKKDRKRLNYAVERLEKERLSLQSSKEDVAKMEDLEKQIEELKSAVGEKERGIEIIKGYTEKYWAEIKRLKKDLTIKTVMSEDEAIRKVVDKLCDIMNGHHCDREQLEYFNSGERYFYLVKGCSPHISSAIFSTNDLIIRIHPKNGRDLTNLDILYLQKTIGNRMEYLRAMNEFEKFKKTNPSNDELVEWTYNKGMELLPIYEDKIF